MCSMETVKHGAIRHMMKESINKPNGITLSRAYQIAVEYLENEDDAVSLLTSDKCNFNRSEINEMLRMKAYNKKYYQQLKLQKA